MVLKDKIVRCFVVSMVLILGCYSYSCDSCVSEEERPLQVKHNYIVLLDLSDRILVDGQIERDISVIESVYNEFLKRLQAQFYFSAIDEFRVVMAYQQNAVPSSKMHELEDQLYVNVEKIKVEQKKYLRDSGDEFIQKVRSLYELARFSNNSNDYKGADIQGYLRDRLSSDMPKADSVVNFLILITDGYQYVEGKSKGIDHWPPVTDLGTINVIVLEMSPRLDRDFEQEKMLTAWNDWLESMNARAIELVPANALSKVQGQLSTFLNPKISVESGSPAQMNNSIQKNVESQPEVGSNILPNGTYVSYKEGKVRMLEIAKTGERGDNEIFNCTLIPLGVNFSDLEGQLNARTGLMTIDKLGVFSIYSDNHSITLASNANDLQFSLRLIK